MGMYVIACQVCGLHYYWFSGNPDQRCALCRDSTLDVIRSYESERPDTKPAPLPSDSSDKQTT